MTDFVASCFEYYCNGSKLFVKLNDQEYRCKSGSLLKPNFFQGTIFCPDNSILCDKKYKCKFGCVDHYTPQDQFKEFPRY